MTWAPLRQGDDSRRERSSHPRLQRTPLLHAGSVKRLRSRRRRPLDSRAHRLLRRWRPARPAPRLLPEITRGYPRLPEAARDCPRQPARPLRLAACSPSLGSEMGKIRGDVGRSPRLHARNCRVREQRPGRRRDCVAVARLRRRRLEERCRRRLHLLARALSAYSCATSKPRGLSSCHLVCARYVVGTAEKVVAVEC